MYLDWFSTGRDTFVIDIETDDLNATLIHVMCWENVKTKEKGACIGLDQIRSFFEGNSRGLFVGHNILKFDARVLNRLASVKLTLANCIDTLILSQLYSPSLAGGHSLDAWGQRLGKPKIEFHAWDKLTPEMIDYCHQDVSITVELFVKLIKVLRKIGFSEKSIDIQHRFMALLDKQHRNGFYFDGQRAMAMLSELNGHRASYEEQIYEAFPPKLERLATYARAYKKDGTPSSVFTRHSSLYESVEVHDDGRYSVFGRTPFNLGSPKQRVEKLTDLGWEPGEFTEKGSPKPFIKGELSPSLDTFVMSGAAPEEVRLIAKWMALTGRVNKLNECLDNWNEKDGCIHGNLFIADTLRLRHQSPNTANIPAVRVRKNPDGTKSVLYGIDGYYTYEARDLWTSRPGRVLVGTDAAGLELRMLANYINREAFTKQVVEGDPHQFNADTAGVSREVAKTLIYAIQYGAQGGKVASIIGGTRSEGDALRTLFLERLGLSEVMENAIHEQETGRVWLVDGSGVVCPSPHAALNYKLQGGGARVMAQGAIFLEGHIRRNGLDSLKVGDIHDEWQYDVDPRDAREHARVSVQAIREAGEELNLNVPLDGTAKEGMTWAETH